MQNPFHDRRQMDANAAINMAAIRGIVGVALILSAGSVALAGVGVQQPDWIGNAVIGITGGLIGYLSRDPKHTQSTSVSGPIENVNVEAEHATTERKPDVQAPPAD